MEPDLLQVSAQEFPPDRYKTFAGIDCDGKARRIMACIEHNRTDSEHDYPFLDYFMAKRAPKSGPIPDDLFLIHSNLNQIREFLEAMTRDPCTCSCNWKKSAADNVGWVAPSQHPAAMPVQWRADLLYQPEAL